MTATVNRINSVLTAARAYREAGLSVIPIKADGSKAPDLPTWKPYQGRLATDDEIAQWYAAGKRGVAVIGGKISGNLECLDFDQEAETIFPEWSALVEEEAPGLLARLVVNRTPKPGYHVGYRCETAVPGNDKLAQDPAHKPPTLIETRGEGGYFLVPGCPLACHETRRPYEHFRGPKLSQVQTITAAERSILIRCAASFDLSPAEEESPRHTGNGVDLRPGDDFNGRGPTFLELLQPHGWALAHQSGTYQRLRRPGKAKGWSATVGYCTGRDGIPLLAVFSSNAEPFPGPAAGKNCSCHSKFDVYTKLNHRGDYSAAAKELFRQGYGSGPRAGQKQEAGDVPLGPLTLRLADARTTPSGKWTATVLVLRDGKPLDRFALTTAASSRKDARRLLAGHLGGNDGIDAALARLVIAAGEKTEKGAANDRPTIRDLVIARVPDAWGLTYRTERGAWSERRAAEVSRGDFIGHIPGALVEAAAEAVDAPRDRGGLIQRPSLIRAVKAELEVAWSDLMDRLPAYLHADLGQDTDAGRLFRSAMVRLWTATRTFEVVKEGQAVVSRASLISRVKTQKAGARGDGRPRWLEVQKAFAAWWRYGTAPDGEEVTRLGMRWELVGQIGVELPGVVDQASLTELGTRFGVLDPAPSVTGRVTGGRSRLSVVSLGFSAELLSEPLEEDETAPQ